MSALHPKADVPLESGGMTANDPKQPVKGNLKGKVFGHICLDLRRKIQRSFGDRMAFYVLSYVLSSSARIRL